MPPDSDNITVQIPENRGGNSNTANNLDADIQMSIEEDQTLPTTPTQPNPPTHPLIPERPIANKQAATFSLVINRTGRNLFENLNTNKLLAGNPEQAI